MLGRGDGQRYGTRQPAVPDHEARIGTGHQQAIIDPDLARQGLGEQCADDEPEPPVDPAGHDRNHGDQHDGPARARNPAGQAVEQTPHGRRTGQHEAGDQHQQHLHRELEQIPEAVAPIAHHRLRRLAFDNNRSDRGDEGQQQYEDVGVRQVAFDQADRGARKYSEHRLERPSIEGPAHANAECAPALVNIGQRPSGGRRLAKRPDGRTISA